MAAAGAGPGPGPGAPPGLEAALQKLALRRKKVLSAEEMELFELAQAAGGAMDPDVFKILVDLLKLNVAPLAVFQMLKSMCAGQRVASDSQDPTAAPLPTPSVPETRGTLEMQLNLRAGSLARNFLRRGFRGREQLGPWLGAPGPWAPMSLS
ncbi:mitotic-spindle organizing protein 2 isoform X2 [Bos taurus]|uniref:mitotic-spindle organizing protein 2 isoform X2 n=1 Tax=Bos taurus TaxID=9913 RepID=UPI000383FD8A|nr:mitotic-spindle organizing protein 2 isoform X2 [Bos taurus]